MSFTHSGRVVWVSGTPDCAVTGGLRGVYYDLFIHSRSRKFIETAMLDAEGLAPWAALQSGGCGWTSVNHCSPARGLMVEMHSGR